MPKPIKPIHFKTTPNHFHTLKKDADMLEELAHNNKGTYRQVHYSRTAIILYILSLEALINRIIDYFWPHALPIILKEDISTWKTVEKWEKVPKLFVGKSLKMDRRPYQYLKPLFKLRNDYVHACDTTYSSAFTLTGRKAESIWEISTSKKGPRYDQIGLLKDPSQWMPEDATSVKNAVEELIKDLDNCFDGKLTLNNWLHSERFVGDNGTILTVERGHFKDIEE